MDNPMKCLKQTALLTLLAFSGCTVEPKDGGVDAQFHPPIVSKTWSTKQYVTSNGLDVCAVSSGYNGLTVTVGEGGAEVVVGSNRIMQPGSTLTVSVGSQRFDAYEAFFKPDTGEALAKAMTNGGKAYLEWSEVSGPVGRERVHVTNILKLDDFTARIRECRKKLDGDSGK